MIRPEDEYFHDPGDNPYWTEAAWFSFLIPERRASGYVYMFHRPNMGTTTGGIAFWDPSGSNDYDCLAFDTDLFAMPDGANMFGYSIPNGLTVRCLEPLKSYHLLYKGEACELDLTWTAVWEPHESGYSELEGWGSNHYEQGGRMVGTIHVEGDTYHVDHWSCRDHSWGNRAPQDNPRGDIPWAIASETSAFCAMATSRLDRSQDLGLRTVEPIFTGWYIRDGEVSSVVEGTRYAERSLDGSPSLVVVDARDALGREFHAEGRPVNLMKWRTYPFLFIWWSMAKWEFDGQEAWGEIQDWWPLQQSRRLMRRLRSDGPLY